MLTSLTSTPTQTPTLTLTLICDIGDNVNVAARLCSGARPGEILVSDAVRNELATGGGADSDSDAATDADRPQLEGPYRMQVKGKAEALRVFRLLDGNADGEGDAP